MKYQAEDTAEMPADRSLKIRHFLQMGLTAAFLVLFSLLFSENAFADGRTEILIGDSRTVEMRSTLTGSYQSSINVKDGNTVWIAQNGMGYSWFENTAMPAAQGYLSAGNADLVILLGTNDCASPSSASNYTNYLAAHQNELLANGNRVFFVSVGPFGHRGGGTETSSGSFSNEGNAVPFNNIIQQGLPAGMTYLDLYDYLVENGYGTQDGVHYDSATYRGAYDQLVRLLTQSTSTNTTNAATGNVAYGVTPSVTPEPAAPDAAKNHTITFNTDGGVLVGSSIVAAKAGNAIPTLPTATKDGFTFAGWFDASGQSYTAGGKMPDQDLVLTAHWTAVTPTPTATPTPTETPSPTPTDAASGADSIMEANESGASSAATVTQKPKKSSDKKDAGGEEKSVKKPARWPLIVMILAAAAVAVLIIVQLIRMRNPAKITENAGELAEKAKDAAADQDKTEEPKTESPNSDMEKKE